MTLEIDPKEIKEKNIVAISSVIAAVSLTLSKFIVGFITGSLGIISEALHSTLDLIAAILTVFAVKISAKPPDKKHNYGHGKVENLSALFQTLLLLVTCGWIILEAYERLVTGAHHIQVNALSFAVIGVSIAVDISRATALKRVAKKYNSQALEADALHFSTDILSSIVVLIGLTASYFNYPIADTISALIVSIIVITISLRLGKRSIDALLDKSDSSLSSQIETIAKEFTDIKKIHDIKSRSSGSNNYVDINIHVDPTITVNEAHEIAHRLEKEIKNKIKKIEVHIHIEPDY